jgi:hypothetical protein
MKMMAPFGFSGSAHDGSELLRIHATFLAENAQL